jgi:small subunit ribosomal protein S13
MLVLGTHLKHDKAIFLALQAIFGLNYSNSLKVCSLIGVSPKSRLSKLRISQLDDLIKVCREEVNTNLQRSVQNNIQSLIQIRHYRGTRHMFGLPARGQRTRTNAQTSKKMINKHQHFFNNKKTGLKRKS